MLVHGFHGFRQDTLAMQPKSVGGPSTGIRLDVGCYTSTNCLMPDGNCNFDARIANYTANHTVAFL
jgi:hypothetical protein